MSYAQAIDSLISRIVMLTPEWDSDRSFVSLETSSSGSSLDLESLSDPVDRYFDFRLRSLPADDGASGYVWSRWQAAIELRVRYQDPGDRARFDRMVASDVAQLTNGCIHPALPAPWHASIDTVEPDGAASIAPIEGPEDRPLGWIVSIPLTLIYQHQPAVE